ncbi:hypothetical protein BDK51DRAFT_31273 [Blyttiomyces helicus]|uniref:Barwin domain-containing protein n=1 Tax=Blyttiomyces helicus TaxID=388810 RepID=A0A4P9WCF8_9FUNG|nr:hypothetical protein BDK51DRAFT_31273 [Blyttiomyces helicus]|eukprot:RKO90184.1 hypothetical protein BDK51DRAFT_31273 [Blyttiomyces helicus]
MHFCRFVAFGCLISQALASKISASTPTPTPKTGSVLGALNSTIFVGSMTYYGDGYKTIQGGADPPPLGPANGGWYGACYDRTGVPKNFNKFAALNGAQYLSLGASAVCGTCVNITHPKTHASTVVQIVDQCPGCSLHGIDVSHQAFAELMGGRVPAPLTNQTWDPAAWADAVDVGIVHGMSWSFVDCAALKPDTVFRVDGRDSTEGEFGEQVCEKEKKAWNGAWNGATQSRRVAVREEM